MFPSRDVVDHYKKTYPKGTKIELIRLDDPYRDLPKGLKGIVDFVDDIAQIHCIWENGSALAVIPGVDSFSIIKEPEVADVPQEESYEPEQ